MCICIFIYQNMHIMYLACIIYMCICDTYMHVNYSSTSLTLWILQTRFLFPVLFSLAKWIFNSLCVVTQLQVSCRHVLAAMAEGKTSQQGIFIQIQNTQAYFKTLALYLSQSGVLTWHCSKCIGHFSVLWTVQILRTCEIASWSIWRT